MTPGNPTGWRHLAACRGLDPELFHPGPGESPAAARAVCCSCPVRAECAEWALFGRVEHHGIWGGLTELDRRRIRRARRLSAFGVSTVEVRA